MPPRRAEWASPATTRAAGESHSLLSLAEADDKQAADALERAVKRLKEQAKPDDGAKDYFGR